MRSARRRSLRWACRPSQEGARRSAPQHASVDIPVSASSKVWRSSVEKPDVVYANLGTASVIFTGVVTKSLETAPNAPTGASKRHAILDRCTQTDARKELQYLVFCPEH